MKHVTWCTHHLHQIHDIDYFTLAYLRTKSTLCLLFDNRPNKAIGHFLDKNHSSLQHDYGLHPLLGKCTLIVDRLASLRTCYLEDAYLYRIKTTYQPGHICNVMHQLDSYKEPFWLWYKIYFGLDKYMYKFLPQISLGSKRGHELASIRGLLMMQWIRLNNILGKPLLRLFKL